MPHDKCSFGVILGYKDMKRLGYNISLHLEDGSVLYEHRGQIKDQIIIDKNTKLFDQINNLPPYGEIYESMHRTNIRREIRSDDNERSYNDDEEEIESEDDEDEDGIFSLFNF